MKPKIVIDPTSLFFPVTGVGRVTRTLINRLLDQKDLPLELCLYSRVMRRALRTPPFSRCRHYHFPLPQRAERWMGKVRWVERATGAGLFHATDHYMALGTPSRAVVTVHDVIFLVHPEQRMTVHAYQRKVVPDFVRRCQRIICPSQHSKDDLIKHLGMDPDHMDVIPWGLDHQTFQPAAPNQETPDFLTNLLGADPHYFLSVNCSEGRKNSPRIIEAYKKLLKQNPTNHLVLVWRNPGAYQEQCKDMDRIHFVQDLTDEELRSLYQHATAMIYPSLYEGFGLPVLEAMACGCPVVTSNTTSLPDVGGELIAQKDSFLAAAKGVSIGIAFQKKLGAGFFGGEGFIMQRLTGEGLAFIHAGGTLVEKTLAPGEVLRVDTGCIVAFQPTVTYDIKFVGGIKSALFGGEGLFFATLQGPGKVWLQSLPFSRLADRVLASAPKSGGKSVGEGSVLGGVGRLFGGS